MPQQLSIGPSLPEDTAPHLPIGSAVCHFFSGDPATTLTAPRRVMIGFTHEWVVDIDHRGGTDKNVSVRFLVAPGQPTAVEVRNV